MDDAPREKLADRRVLASISGGKDSAAMTLWLTEQGIEHDRVFLDTGWEHPITYEYLRGDLTRALGPIQELSAGPSRRLRIEAIRRLGGKCACCGEAHLEFLAFDHVGGGGSAERRRIGYSKFRRMAVSGAIDHRLRILCHNCNLAIGFYGKCPHEPPLS